MQYPYTINTFPGAIWTREQRVVEAFIEATTATRLHRAMPQSSLQLFIKRAVSAIVELPCADVRVSTVLWVLTTAAEGLPIRGNLERFIHAIAWRLVFDLWGGPS